jgi:hypothetical protein
VGKPEGRRPLGRPRRGWLHNTSIMMDLVEVEWGDVDWIGLAQDRNGWRSLVNAGKLSSGLSRIAQLCRCVHNVVHVVHSPKVRYARTKVCTL